MCPFWRKKQDELTPGVSCPFCGSRDTRPLAGDSGVKTWRGQRSVVYRCFACSRDFYTDGTPAEREQIGEDEIVEDEEALLEAEEELRQQVKEDDDRRFPRYL